MSAAPIAVVIGGAGFIASHMVDLLLSPGFALRVIDDLKGRRLRNLDQHTSNPRLDVTVADVRDVKPGSALFAGARRAHPVDAESLVAGTPA